MAEAEQDQIIFVMAVGDERFHKSVPAGQGRDELEAIVGGDSRWIEVDDSHWINRDHVLYGYVTAAGEDQGPMITAV